MDRVTSASTGLRWLYDKTRCAECVCMCQQFMPWIIKRRKRAQRSTSVLFVVSFQFFVCFVRFGSAKHDPHTHIYTWSECYRKLNQSYHFCSFGRPSGPAPFDCTLLASHQSQILPLSPRRFSLLKFSGGERAIKLQNVCELRVRASIFQHVSKMGFYCRVYEQSPESKLIQNQNDRVLPCFKRPLKSNTTLFAIVNWYVRRRTKNGLTHRQMIVPLAQSPPVEYTKCRERDRATDIVDRVPLLTSHSMHLASKPFMILRFSVEIKENIPLMPHRWQNDAFTNNRNVSHEWVWAADDDNATMNRLFRECNLSRVKWSSDCLLIRRHGKRDQKRILHVPLYRDRAGDNLCNIISLKHSRCCSSAFNWINSDSKRWSRDARVRLLPKIWRKRMEMLIVQKNAEHVSSRSHRRDNLFDNKKNEKILSPSKRVRKV